jgi:two-component system sensor histidine kinase GlrK
MKLTIFKRLVAGFLLMLIVVVALGAYATLKFRELSLFIPSIRSIDSETIMVADRLREIIFSQMEFEKKYALWGDQDFFRQFLATEPSFQKELDELDNILDRKGNKRGTREIKKIYKQYLEAVQTEVSLIRIKQEYSKEDFEKIKEDLIDDLFHQLNELKDDTEKELAAKIQMSSQICSQAYKIILILSISSIVMALLIAFFNARTIHRPISHMIREIKEIAQGKFEKHLNIPSPPEINELAMAFNHMCDRLKELDEMKADLIANVSHEFRTPLAVIREAVSLYIDSVDTASREKQSKLLGIVQEECERLIDSVNKVLNLSRMDAGIIDYQMEKYNLSHLIAIGVSKVQPIATRKEIALGVDVSSDSLYAVMDPEKMGQVFDNLLGNALKFTPEKGKVSIGAVLRQTDMEGYSGDNKKEFIEVRVSDTGPGIPEENIHDIFDKYKKLHEKGTGLGLYIARQIINAHGGNIWVESNGKTGSTFFFTVPVS